MGNGVSTNLSVEDLRFELNPSNRKQPTIRLTWRGRTGRRYHPTDIEYVIYANDQELQVVSGPVTSATISTLEPLKHYTFRVVARHKRTRQEGLFYGSFQTFLDWKCKTVECEKSRWVIKDPIYVPENEESFIHDFCCVQDKVVWEMDHCLHSECRRPPDHNSFFCSDENDAHRFLTKQRGDVYFVLCQPSSERFQEMERIFEKNWDKSKCLIPTVCTVIAVVNPALEDRLEAYKSSLRKGCHKTEFHFHGTKLKCPLHKYYMPCQQRDCSVCGISRNGFLLERVSIDYQHFARAFYLAPTSSKCHDYCATQISDDRKVQENPYYAMLYCEVATGKKYHLKRKETFRHGPPDGYHTLYGKSIQMPFLQGDSRNDELVVFDEEAICPKYIVCYTVLQP